MLDLLTMNRLTDACLFICNYLNMKLIIEILKELQITFQKEMDYFIDVIFPELMKRLLNKLKK